MMILHVHKKLVISILSLTVVLFLAYLFFYEYHDESSIRFGYPVEHTILTENIDFYEFNDFNEHLEITELNQISQEIAAKLSQEKIMLFLSLFERQRIGYKGQHTDFIDCPDKYKPVSHEVSVNGGHLKYYSGFANERFVFGSCDRETSKNHAVNAFLYCSKSKRLLEVKYFIPVKSSESVEAFIEKLNCQNVD